MKRDIPGWLSFLIIIAFALLLAFLYSYATGKKAAEEKAVALFSQPLERLEADIDQAADELQLFLAFANGEEHRTT